MYYNRKMSKTIQSPLLEPDRPRIGISSCLLGEKVRFDGGHKRDRFITDLLGPCVEWVMVCPEVEVGMGIPRPSVRLQGASSAPRMVEPKSGDDWTSRMNTYSRSRVRELRTQNLCGFILKKDSPSCGMERVRVYPGGKSQAQRDGQGLFAAALMKDMPLLPVEEEGRLNDMPLRENFVERVFAYQRWRQLEAGRKSRGALVDFHARHKLQLLAHNETHMRKMGRLVAAMKNKPLAEVYAEYGQLFMQALSTKATPRRHTNVLQHVLGHFSDRLEPEERQELLAEINDYRRGLIPLVVPLTLVRHYVRKFKVEYIQDQIYLSPHPRELMLRNHV